VIIKGGSRGRSAQLAAHLLRTDQNEKVEVREVRGTVATDLLGALEEIEATAISTRSRKPFYHASISPPPDRRLTARQWSHAIDALERALGLKGQPRVVVAHIKGKRQHVHVVWSRIDIEHGRTISDSWNYRIHEGVARDLEREFGHEPLRGVFTGRDDQQPRPKRTTPWHDQRQEERSGIRNADVEAEITAIWRSTTQGDEFRQRLHDARYLLARGDRRSFVIVDAAGGVHALARRIDGVRTRDIRARFSDSALSDLPSVADARATMRDRLQSLQRESVIAEIFIDPSALLEFTGAKSAVTHPEALPRKLLRQTTRVAARFYNNKMRPSESEVREGRSLATDRRGLKRIAKPPSFGVTSRARRSQPKDRRISSYAQERAAILLLFGSKIAAAQLYSPKDQLAAIINALKAEERAALNSLRERETTEI
jgi:hypothetical protein